MNLYTVMRILYSLAPVISDDISIKLNEEDELIIMFAVCFTTIIIIIIKYTDGTTL